MLARMRGIVESRFVRTGLASVHILNHEKRNYAFSFGTKLCAYARRLKALYIPVNIAIVNKGIIAIFLFSSNKTAN